MHFINLPLKNSTDFTKVNSFTTKMHFAFFFCTFADHFLSVFSHITFVTSLQFVFVILSNLLGGRCVATHRQM